MTLSSFPNSSPTSGEEVSEVRTVVFTDLVGSLEHKNRLGDAAALELFKGHRAELRSLLAMFPDAREIDTQGDSFLMLFPRPSEAVRFALIWQSRLRQFSREKGQVLRDRVGIHTGELIVLRDVAGHKPLDVHGLAVDVAARVMQLATGGQILMTRATLDGARQSLGDLSAFGISPPQWVIHGPYQLRGTGQPLEIAEVGETGQGPLKAPPVLFPEMWPLVEKRLLPPQASGLLFWRQLKLAIPGADPGDQWLIEREQDGELVLEDVTRPQAFELAGDAPVNAYRIRRGDPVELELLIPEASTDENGHHWDLILSPLVSIADGPRLLRAGGRVLLSRKSVLPAEDLSGWLVPRLSPPLKDRLGERSYAEIRSSDAMPLSVWMDLLQAPLAAVGLKLEMLPPPTWISADAQAAALRQAEHQRRLEMEKAAKEAQARQAALEAAQRAKAEADQIREAELADQRRRAERQGISHAAEVQAMQAQHEANRISQQTEIERRQGELRATALLRELREAEHGEALAKLAAHEEELISESRKRARADAIVALNQEAEKAALQAHAGALADLNLKIRVGEAEKRLEEIRVERARLAREEEAGRQRHERIGQELEAAQTSAAEARQQAAGRLGEIAKGVAAVQDQMGQSFQNTFEQLDEVLRLVKKILAGQSPADVFAEADSAGLHQETLDRIEPKTPRLRTALFAERYLELGRRTGRQFTIIRRGVRTRNLVSAHRASSKSGGTGGYTQLQVRMGEPNYLEFLAPQAGHVTLINPGTSGDFYLLTPNDEAPSVPVNSGDRLTAPGRLIPKGLGPQSGPPGDEYLLALITPEPLVRPEDLAQPNQRGGLSRLDPESGGDIAPFRHLHPDLMTRIEQQLEALPADSWSAGVLRYLVVPA